MFDHKSPNYNKLLSYGFTNNGEIYTYKTLILNRRFEMRIDISSVTDNPQTNIIDLSTDEPYTLHLVADACGAFVGAVRAEYERILSDISENCYEKDVFKSEIAHKVIEYIRRKYGDELEYLWRNFPTNAVWRRKDNNKWYGVLLVVSKRKLGIDSDDTVDIIDLRIEPDTLGLVIDEKKYFYGYHMNKKHWLTVCLDGSVEIEEIIRRIDISYELAAKK